MDYRVIEKSGNYRIQKKTFLFWYTLADGFGCTDFYTHTEIIEAINKLIDDKKNKRNNWRVIDTWSNI